MRKINRYCLLLICVLLYFEGSAQQSKALHELDFQLTNQYRNNILEPTWPIYNRNFKNDPLNGSLPRFEEIGEGELLVSKTGNGLKFTSDKQSGFKINKVFPRIQAPCVLAKLQVTPHTKSHQVQLGFVKDKENSALLKRVGKEFVFELKQKNKETIRKNFEGIDTNKQAYTLYFFLGNDDFRFMIENQDGLHHIGIVSEKRSCFTRQNEFSGFSPAFGIELARNESVSIGSFSAGYFEGIGHADIRSVTYENGDPIQNEKGNYYISTSSRFMGKNGGSGGICVYEMDSNGRIVRPVSLIVAEDENWIEAGTAAKLVFDRDSKQWLYVARAFPSPGGMLHIGKSKENLLADGLHLIHCKKYPGIVENSLDGDLIKIDKNWFIAYHGGRPRQLHIAKSEDLENWEEISANDTGEGIAIAKMNGEHLIVDATSPTQMDVRKLFAPAEVTGTIQLNPSPGNHRKHGGFPWGCIIPVKNEDSIRYLMVCFSMDEYMEKDSGDIFTYGDIFSYSSEKIRIKK